MANLREIKGRIDSVKSTMQVTRTMEMISTAKIRRALDRAKEAEPYKDAITRMLANVTGVGFDATQPLLQPRKEVHNVLFILIASDRGMAGGFNIVPQRMVQHEMAELAAQGISSELITCGKKPTEYFTYRGVTPVMSFTDMSSEPTMDEADRIASYLMDGYADGILVCRSEFESPEVDGEILVPCPQGRSPQSFVGQFITVRINGADDYDLTGDYLRD